MVSEPGAFVDGSCRDNAVRLVFLDRAEGGDRQIWVELFGLLFRLHEELPPARLIGEHLDHLLR